MCFLGYAFALTGLKEASPLFMALRAMLLLRLFQSYRFQILVYFMGKSCIISFLEKENYLLNLHFAREYDLKFAIFLFTSAAAVEIFLNRKTEL